MFPLRYVQKKMHVSMKMTKRVLAIATMHTVPHSGQLDNYFPPATVPTCIVYQFTAEPDTRPTI
jgi:hypothetical protein